VDPVDPEVFTFQQRIVPGTSHLHAARAVSVPAQLVMSLVWNLAQARLRKTAA
jgi:hypothetical protein